MNRLAEQFKSIAESPIVGGTQGNDIELRLDSGTHEIKVPPTKEAIVIIKDKERLSSTHQTMPVSLPNDVSPTSATESRGAFYTFSYTTPNPRKELSVEQYMLEQLTPGYANAVFIGKTSNFRTRRWRRHSRKEMGRSTPGVLLTHSSRVKYDTKQDVKTGVDHMRHNKLTNGLKTVYTVAITVFTVLAAVGFISLAIVSTSFRMVPLFAAVMSAALAGIFYADYRSRGKSNG